MSYTSTNHISLDIYNNSIVSINAKQFDSSARNIEVTCTENGKKIVLVKDEVKVYLGCTKPDGKYILNECEILENGTTKVNLTQQILAEAGKCKMDLMLIDANGDININKRNELVLLNTSILSTMHFYVNVIPSSVDHAAIESSNEYNALLSSMSKNIALEKELQENENGIINESGVVIKDGRVQVEEKRVQAEIVREQQEANRIETFRVNEESRQNTFNSNENNRENTFTTHESNRKITFETNEENRQDTFESNENSRTSTFENNETERTNTFNTKEQNRQDTFDKNETNRTNEFQTKISTWNDNVNATINKSEAAELNREQIFTTSMSEWSQNVSDTVQECNTSIQETITDFTSKVNTLMESCNTAETKRDTAEQSRVTAENNREKNTVEAVNKCSTATSNADNATERANNAAKACEDIVQTGVVLSSEKGTPEGVATLDSDGTVPNEQINTNFETLENVRTPIVSGDSLENILNTIRIYMNTVDSLLEKLDGVIDTSNI